MARIGHAPRAEIPYRNVRTSRKVALPFMYPFRRIAGACLLSVSGLCLSACASFSSVGRISYAAQASDPLATYPLTGDTLPVLDPSIIRQGDTYYAFSTDVTGFKSSGNLPIHCSPDKIHWTRCGSVFPNGIPRWIPRRLSGVTGLWAPDISYFNGEYHLYYNASTLYTQRTVIGLVTNTTLDSTDPAYKWIDRGVVLQSKNGDDFNALDPNVFIDADGQIWLTFGSYWSGIKQRQVDPASGMLLASNPTRYNLATRPGVRDDAIEGASLVRHGNYYYLFVSMDHCCTASTATDDYKQAVGRSTSPHGPFVDENGTPMMKGGGTILLKGDGSWNAPGGGTAYLDPTNGDSLLIFHAQNLQEGGTPHVWLKNLAWQNDWPVLADISSASSTPKAAD
jgi:arabinan endo-1,5-alpha-L-arabinosidase